MFACSENALQWWKQGAKAPEFQESIPAGRVEQFFRSHQEKFSPERVYQAKTWGRFRTEYQLSFVDLGLMPLVEEEVGRSLGTLIERNVSELRNRLNWGKITEDQGRWLLQTVFWLISGKILRDKRVVGFEDLNLTDVEEVFHRLGRHYGTDPLNAGPRKQLDALCGSAQTIDQFSSLILTTTESLAFVYENTLISKRTRSSLGTHSTPSFLVDYILGNLADWIKEIPAQERSVFEPACGHAAFLVSAMRLLTEMLPSGEAVPSRRGPYLRRRLHGNDIDSFALELARLSLTLTDIPNPNGWDLNPHDMFLDNRLPKQASRNTILLANPPFDDFSAQERDSYRDRKSPVHLNNKCAEVLRQTVPQLPGGAVFGVVLPQTFLHSSNAKEIREFLVRECELKEICLFPDKVFPFSGAESAIVIGRRKKIGAQNYVRYRRVRERDFQLFRSDYVASTTRIVTQSRFFRDQSFSMRVPDLEEVWDTLGKNPTLAEVAGVAKGLDYRAGLPASSTTYSDRPFQGSHLGFIRLGRKVQLHELPEPYWMNLDAAVVSSARIGTRVGDPQVLLNYARTSRGPWRLKALLDKQGHPVTSRFIAVRPTSSVCSIETLWALLNSPVANAYAYSHLAKRDNIVGDIRKIPLPRQGSFQGVDWAANAYLEAAASDADPTILQRLMLRIDAEVLSVYSLPIELEHSLLAVFTGWERVGVPFKQTRYLPKELENSVRFSDFVQFEADWHATNRERGLLIDKKISGKITREEQMRLDALQAYADYHIDQVAPRPTHVLDELEKRLFPGLPKKDGHA